MVLQYIVLATAWNILGGYTGYVNFGTSAFFAIGAYCTGGAVQARAAAAAGGDAGRRRRCPACSASAPGYLTLRLRGAFFSIATLAMAVVVQTLMTNWDFVGGSRGAYRHPTADRAAISASTTSDYLFLLMLACA